MRRPASTLIILAALAASARAEMGPCRPDAFAGLVCGEGAGAARVIDETHSPDRSLAFAWRDPKGAPSEPPETGTHELVLVRLSDGAVLARTSTEYWATGETRANRLSEEVRWSSDGRLALRAFQQRFDTGRLDLFMREGDTVRLVDLKALVLPAIKAKRGRQPLDRWAFFVVPHEGMAVGPDRVRFKVMMWVPKEGPRAFFDVAVRLTRQGPRIASVTRGREPRW